MQFSPAHESSKHPHISRAVNLIAFTTLLCTVCGCVTGIQAGADDRARDLYQEATWVMVTVCVGLTLSKALHWASIQGNASALIGGNGAVFVLMYSFLKWAFFMAVNTLTSSGLYYDEFCQHNQDVHLCFTAQFLGVSILLFTLAWMYLAFGSAGRVRERVEHLHLVRLTLPPVMHRIMILTQCTVGGLAIEGLSSIHLYHHFQVAGEYVTRHEMFALALTVGYAFNASKGLSHLKYVTGMSFGVFMIYSGRLSYVVSRMFHLQDHNLDHFASLCGVSVGLAIVCSSQLALAAVSFRNRHVPLPMVDVADEDAFTSNTPMKVIYHDKQSNAVNGVRPQAAPPVMDKHIEDDDYNLDEEIAQLEKSFEEEYGKGFGRAVAPGEADLADEDMMRILDES